MNFSSLFIASIIFSFSLNAMETDYFKSLPESTQALVAAVSRNDSSTAIALLKNGINPNASLNIYGRPYGEELVTVAARNSNEVLLQALFDSGAPVYGLYGEPVRQAAQFGNTKILDLLLSCGATVQSAQEGLNSAKNQHDLTPERCTQIQAVINKHKANL